MGPRADDKSRSKRGDAGSAAPRGGDGGSRASTAYREDGERGSAVGRDGYVRKERERTRDHRPADRGENWTCEACGLERQWATRTKCRKCHAPRQEGDRRLQPGASGQADAAPDTVRATLDKVRAELAELRTSVTRAFQRCR